jgi:hypothetical protein
MANGIVKQLWLNSERVLWRPGATYLVAAGTPIFNIIGGPVLIKFLMGILTANEAAGAATLDFDINAIGVTGGACGGMAAAVIDDQVLCFLDGATACALSVGGAPGNIVTPATPTCYVMASPGAVTITVGAFQIDGIGFSIIWQKLNPASEIVLA